MDRVSSFSIYYNSYLDLLPKELKILLFNYIYGQFYLTALNTYGSQFRIILTVPILNHSELDAVLPIETISDLAQFNALPIPIPQNLELTKKTKDNRLYIKSRTIYIDGFVILHGIDADDFIMKLKKMYNHLIKISPGQLSLQIFYY